MRADGKSALVTMILLAAALPALGQAGANCARCSQVQRQPYTVEFKLTHVQMLTDGTTITRETKEIEAVDSQGRRLNANSMDFPMSQEGAQIMHTNVQDPVENTQASWDSRTKTARVIKLPPQDQRHGCWANEEGNYRMNYAPIRPQAQIGAGTGSGGASAGVFGVVTASGSVPPGPIALPSSGTVTMASSSSTVVTVPAAAMPRPAVNRPVSEDLGTDVIEGVEVHGYRMTRTIPVGQIGNDRPIVSINEYWQAPSLGGLSLRSVNDSPQSGKQTRDVVSLSIGDPDPSVFQPPEGYKVTVEELHEVPCQQMQQ